MGRPPSNGVPSFRFNGAEVAEMEAILQAHNAQMPSREILDALAEKFSTSAERSGKFVVQMKQIWNWFQNRRYAIRAKSGKPPVKLAVSTPLHNSTTTTAATAKNVPPPQLVPCSTAPVRSMPQNTKITAAPPVQDAVRNVSESQMEFEARSARDGAWYDVTSFISHRYVETGDPEVLVRFAGFGPEEDEWVNVRKHIRQRSLPCESAECIVVLPGDLILCFQEGKEQALYYDAHILDSQRRRHDIRGCRCRFLVRYDHDQSEEIVPLRKICRRPETDHRLQQLDADSSKVNQQNTGVNAHSNNTTKVGPPTKIAQKEQNQTADRRVNGNVALDDSQPISGSHTHLAHIPNVNKNSELTHPRPITESGVDSTSAQVRPETESHAAVEAKVNQISESTQLPVAESVSDTVATKVLPPDSPATDVVKVNQTSEMTQLQPIAETNANTVASEMLPELENRAALVAETTSTQNSLTIPSQSQAPLAETTSNTVDTLVLPAPENQAAAASTQNSLPVSSQSELLQL